MPCYILQCEGWYQICEICLIAYRNVQMQLLRPVSKAHRQLMLEWYVISTWLLQSTICIDRVHKRGARSWPSFPSVPNLSQARGPSFQSADTIIMIRSSWASPKQERLLFKNHSCRLWSCLMMWRALVCGTCTWWISLMQWWAVFICCKQVVVFCGIYYIQ